MPLPKELRPTPLEVAAGTVVGWSPPSPLPAVPTALTPLDALEEALVPALERGRCFVAFSGGRDSSAMLVAAVRAARRRGLALPIPVTLRFAAGGAVDETDWQEHVIAHLRVEDWERIEIGDELDLLGPIARETLLRHRLPWPGNGHSFVPMLAAAHGGSLVTGADGDGLLEHWQWAPRPGARGIARRVKSRAPTAVRRAELVRRRRPFARLPWLTEDARRAVTRAYAREHATEPRRWDERVAWYRGRRGLRVMRAGIDASAADHDATVVHPLVDPRFLAALARVGGADGFAGRTQALRAVFGDLLSEKTTARTTKAEFSGVFWGPEARRFAREWDGRGADPALVDPDALRAAWLAPRPHAQSISMLASLWLQTAEQGGDLVE